MIGLPSLEYQHAFDLCAAGIGRGGGANLVVASNRFYAREAITRLRQPHLIADGWSAADDFPQTPVTTFDQADAPFSGILWAEPLADTAAVTFARIDDLLAPDGVLAVVSGGALARFLPDVHQAGQTPLKWSGVRALLKPSGLTLNRAVGFHGVSSILWSYGFRLMGTINRLDLADRCLVKMRTVYAVPDGRACTLHAAIFTRIASANGKHAA